MSCAICCYPGGCITRCALAANASAYGGSGNGIGSADQTLHGNSGAPFNAGNGTLDPTQLTNLQAYSNAQQNALPNSSPNFPGQSAFTHALVQQWSGGFMGIGGMAQAYTGPQYASEPLPCAETAFGELIGYRIWNVRSGFLASYSATYVWPPGYAAEGEPDDYGNGGLWAFRIRGAAMHKLADTGPAGTWAMGSVELYGDVVEHSGGYRAQYAFVRSIDEVRLGYDSGGKWWEQRGVKKAILQALRETYDCEQ